MNSLTRFLPFLRWFPLRSEIVRADLLAGVTVALVLIPQSMAYAQLAGLPAYYGLYAAFLPVIVGALWGSSSQLATGPVAVVSLLTASALAPLALTGSDQFIALAIMLAFMVGVVQFLLGTFKLGVVVNFLSHPVIVGFTNAAAIIIGLSQLNKIFGVSMPRSDSFIQDIWAVFQQLGDTHFPTLIMGISAFALMYLLKRYYPKLPGVLIAVVLTTVISWLIGFEHNGKARVEAIQDPAIRTLAEQYTTLEQKINSLQERIAARSEALKRLKRESREGSEAIAALNYNIELLSLELKEEEKENRQRHRTLRKQTFELAPSPDGVPRLYLSGQLPEGVENDGYRWRIKKISKGELSLIGGGEVVGSIPSGLPNLEMPKFSWESFVSLLSTAFVIALVAFMEAISIAKAMAAKTKERIDPNRELIGQGLANMVGSFSQSYPVSGSFSRSAVNLNAGAVTGMSSVFTALIVLATLLFLTPLLYHLPQAVLAAVIMMAVIGLINFKGIKHAWHAHKHDGIAAIVTFLATLAFAPHLDMGIMVGAGLAIGLYLFRTMKPRAVILGRHADGTLRDAKLYNLPTSEYITAIRFDGSLYFANVPYFEDAVLEAVSKNPKAKYLLVVGDGINELDASGEEVIHQVVQRLKDNGITVVFSGLKKQVLDTMETTGLIKLIGEQNFFRTEDMALETIYGQICEVDPSAEFCPLRPRAVMV